MKSAVFVLCSLLLLSVAFAAFSYTQEAIDNEFGAFMKKHGRAYSADEYEHRRSIFIGNMRRIDYLNNLKDGAGYGITPFADMTPEEFRAQYLSPISLPSDAEILSVRKVRDAPASFDWRDHGAVGKVLNQGSCGSCWAFSTIQNVEGQWFLAGHDFVDLSPQQLVDCDTEKDQGCNGGLPWNAYEYIISNKGLDTEASYPYVGFDDTCKFKSADVGATISSWKQISSDEDQIRDVLATQGPLSAALNANWLQFYVGGISDPLFCDPKSLDHAILLVGYGRGKDWLGIDMDYWLVKNSWGESWGEKGYFRMRRGKGVCGINTAVTTSLV